MIFLALIAAASFTLDSEMSAKERKKTGLYKLTRKERIALQDWIDAHYDPKSSPIPLQSTKKAPTNSQILQGGNYVLLSDNTMWEIHPQDTPIAQGWITPVEIIVEKTGHADYPYKLTNSLTGSSLRARKVDHVPEPSQREEQ